MHGAHRCRNPDEDVPHDCDGRRDEYSVTRGPPRAAAMFVETVRGKLAAALAAFAASGPTDSKVQIVTGKMGKGRMRLPPLEAQPEPPNIVAVTAALVQRWPMTTLLDILQETARRVHCTEAFRTLGTRAVLSPQV